MLVRARKSRFTLSTLPAAEFPTVEEINAEQALQLPQKDFKRLLDKTHFSMAQQDVRYYLNGLLLETSAKMLRAVATDGHRLALCEVELPNGGKSGQQVIVPRKGVLELQRILGNEDQMLEVSIGSNHLRVQIGDIRFTSKLIDGRFPEYSRVIPATPPKTIGAVRDDLRQALQRAAILSNEKYRGIRFALKPNALMIQAHNPEQEEAEEEVEVTYDGEELEIGFNVNYLLGRFGGGGRRRRPGRSDRRQQQLPDPGDARRVCPLRRHADAALSRQRTRERPSGLGEPACAWFHVEHRS